MATTHHGTRRAACRAGRNTGGWVIDLGGGHVWHTDDEGAAIDLALSLTDDNREAAERVVRSPRLQTDRFLVLDRKAAARLADVQYDITVKTCQNCAFAARRTCPWGQNMATVERPIGCVRDGDWTEWPE